MIHGCPPLTCCMCSFEDGCLSPHALRYWPLISRYFLGALPRLRPTEPVWCPCSSHPSKYAFSYAMCAADGPRRWRIRVWPRARQPWQNAILAVHIAVVGDWLHPPSTHERGSIPRARVRVWDPLEFLLHAYRRRVLAGPPISLDILQSCVILILVAAAASTNRYFSTSISARLFGLV